jgi:hypothetical protein
VHQDDPRNKVFPGINVASGQRGDGRFSWFTGSHSTMDAHRLDVVAGVPLRLQLASAPREAKEERWPSIHHSASPLRDDHGVLQSPTQLRTTKKKNPPLSSRTAESLTPPPDDPLAICAGFYAVFQEPRIFPEFWRPKSCQYDGQVDRGTARRH